MSCSVTLVQVADVTGRQVCRVPGQVAPVRGDGVAGQAPLDGEVVEVGAHDPAIS
jgi:hypothetical protein